MELQISAVPASEQVLAQVAKNNALITAAYADNLRLLTGAGLLSSDHLTRDEQIMLVERDFHFDKLTAEDLAPALLRVRHKGDGIPAHLTLSEGQIISAFRFVGGAGFGSVNVGLHEKRRTSISVSLIGR